MVFTKDCNPPMNESSTQSSNILERLVPAGAALNSESLAAKATSDMENTDGKVPPAAMRRHYDKLRNRVGGSMSIAAMAAAAAREKNAKSIALTSSLTAAIDDDDATLPVHSQLPIDKSPANHADLSTVTYACVACGKRLDKSQFSKNQLTKYDKLRCKKCCKAQRPAQLDPNPSNEEVAVPINDTNSCTAQDTAALSEKEDTINDPNTADENDLLVERQASQKEILAVNNDYPDEMRSKVVLDNSDTDVAEINCGIGLPSTSTGVIGDDDKGLHSRLLTEHSLTKQPFSSSFKCICSACGKQLEKSHFSKNQLTKAKKNGIVRCKKCIAAQ